MENMEKFCCFNSGVDCDNHNCSNCGWNPVVKEKRLKSGNWIVNRKLKVDK